MAPLLVVVALLITACSGNAEPVSTDGNDGAPTGEVRFQLYQAPTGFNPFAASNGADSQIASLQYAPLVRTRDNEFVPALAESWEVSPDASTYTFKLRDATWSDGEPFTADDVVYTIETALDPATTSALSGPLTAIEGAAEFAAGEADEISGLVVDGSTLTMTLSKPDAGFLGSLLPMYVVPEHVFGAIPNAELKGNPLFREPEVGMGAYQFSRWVSDDQIEFVANDEYWVEPKLERIYAQYLTGDVALAQLKTGEIDIAQLSVADVADAKVSDEFEVVETPGNAVMTLHTAIENGVLADKRVRQAVLYAIDRQAIVENVLAGSASVPATVLFTPDWAVPDDLNPYEYDPEKAEELLAEANWDPNTTVRLNIVPGTPDRDAVMNIIEGQLKEVGIKAEITPMQPATVSDVVAKQEFDLLITPVSLASSAEPAGINNRLLCDQRAPNGINITGYCNPELDDLLLEASATADQGVREQLYAQVQKILSKEQPILPLYVATTHFGVSPSVSGFDPTAPVSSAEDWSVTNG